MVPTPLARAQAMRSRTCADVFQPCSPSLVPGDSKIRDPKNEVARDTG